MNRKLTKYKYIIIVSLVMVSILSCEKKNLDYLEVRSASAFTEVELHSTFEVYLTEDSVHSITISGREDVVKNIMLDVKNGVLKINDPRKSEWRTPTTNKIQLNISSPPLNKLTTFEACNIRTSTAITSNEFGLVLGAKANDVKLELDCNTFYYWTAGLSGGGKITLSGITNELKLWNNGLVQVDALKLSADYALVENKSRGNCEIMVNNKLDYSIFNSGNIIVIGNPDLIVEIERHEESTGQLIER